MYCMCRHVPGYLGACEFDEENGNYIWCIVEISL